MFAKPKAPNAKPKPKAPEPKPKTVAAPKVEEATQEAAPEVQEATQEAEEATEGLAEMLEKAELGGDLKEMADLILEEESKDP